jgi:hypothetical protein
VQLLHLRHLLAVLLLEQVNRLLADHAGQRTVARDQLDALADEDLRVPATDADEVQEPLVGDVRDDQPDLVDVAHHHQQRALAAARHPGHR